jgi:hypothetical protein
MNTKTLLVGAGIGILTLGSLSFAAVNGKLGKGADFSAVKTAVEANNYAGLPDTAKAKITETMFADMVQKNIDRTAVEKAVADGDYTAFKNAMIAQIPTEPEFQKMVTMHQARIETQAKVEAAVKNNDFAAFRTAIEAQKVQMVAEHPGMEDVAPKALWDEKLQKHFDSLVAYYKTNGKLPEMGKGFWPMGGGMMGAKWMGHGPRGK